MNAELWTLRPSTQAARRGVADVLGLLPKRAWILTKRAHSRSGASCARSGRGSRGGRPAAWLSLADATALPRIATAVCRCGAESLSDVRGAGTPPAKLPMRRHSALSARAAAAVTLGTRRRAPDLHRGIARSQRPRRGGAHRLPAGDFGWRPRPSSRLSRRKRGGRSGPGAGGTRGARQRCGGVRRAG